MHSVHSSHTFRSFLSLAALLAVCAVPASGMSFPWPTAPQLEASSRAFSAAPGVVADASSGTVFLMAPDSLEVIGLADGRLRWQSTEAAKPLMLWGDYVVAQAPVVPGRQDLEIRLLRRADGQLVHRASSAMPAGVWPTVDDGLGRQFQIRAYALGDTLALDWHFVSQKVTGASPDLVPTAGRQELSGRLLLDPASGTLVASEQPIEWQRSRPDLPAGERLAGIEGHQFRAAGAESMMTSEAIADARVWDRYRWQIYSLNDGSSLGEIRAPVSWAPFLVTGNTLAYVAAPHIRRIGDELVSEDRQLRAFDLSNGRELWTRTLRETAYRGPFPP